MYLDATQKDFDGGSIIVIDSAFLYAKGISSDKLWLKFNGYSDGPMFVVDIINNEIKLIFPKSGEINYAKIDSFNSHQQLELSIELRKFYQGNSKSTETIPFILLQELFKQSSI